MATVAQVAAGISQDRLKHLLSYSAESGAFVWKNPTSNRVKKGAVAGATLNTGYIQIKLDGRFYLAHRLAWLYMHGQWPEYEIDHIDGVRNNNAANNLRDVTRLENSKNKSANSNNTSGNIGVYRGKREGQWRAQIKVEGVVHFSEYFDNYDDALNERMLMEAKFGFHENHGRKARGL